MDNHALLDTSIDQGDGDARFANVAPLSDDWYHGHKVVAMPSSAFGGMSIREVVSSRNENDHHQERPRRSNSLGRQPMVRPGGRDLVQDVYDRMGVSYTRGMTYENSSSGFELQYEQPETPMAIQSQPSFSESVTSNNTNNTNNNHSSSGGGKLKDKFSGRYRAAAAVGRTGDRGRGRTLNTQPCVNDRSAGAEESEGQKRARSLSRGRSVQGRWPPSRDQAANANADVTTQKMHMSGGIPAGASSESSTATPSWNSHQQTSPPSPERRTGQMVSTKIKRSHSFDARPQYGRGGGGLRSPVVSGSSAANPNQYHNKMRIAPPSTADSVNSNSNSVATMRDEKKENDDASESTAAEDEGAAAIPSIKDRISAFAGKKTNTGGQRNSRRNTFGGPPSGNMKSPPPPKVNIYEQSSRKQEESYGHPDDPSNAFDQDNHGEDEYSQSQGPPEPSNIPPSATAAAAADVAAKYMRPSQTKKKSHRNSTGGGGVRGGSSIANSYLTGINSPGGTANNGAPAASSRSCFQQPAGTGTFAEVPFNASDEVMDGNSSVGASSAVSYGDGTHASATRKSAPVWQKPATAYSNNNRSVVTSKPSSDSHAAGGNISTEMIEKLVDERVQVQLREVEARMEGLLRRWMDQMNTKITTRLDAMESSIKDSMPDPYHRHEL